MKETWCGWERGGYTSGERFIRELGITGFPSVIQVSMCCFAVFINQDVSAQLVPATSEFLVRRF